MRRTRLSRKTKLRSSAKRRDGVSKAFREELKELHRRVVMVRYGKAYAVEPEREGGNPPWWGPCAWCGKEGWLYCCHIEPVGQYPALRYDPENAFPGCYNCHINVWHKSSRRAEEWIKGYIGEAARERLALRALTTSKPDLAAIRVALVSELPPSLRQVGSPASCAPPPL